MNTTISNDYWRHPSDDLDDLEYIVHQSRLCELQYSILSMQIRNTDKNKKHKLVTYATTTK